MIDRQSRYMELQAKLNRFATVTLEDMSGVKLMNRIDTKYLTSIEKLLCLLEMDVMQNIWCRKSTTTAICRITQCISTRMNTVCMSIICEVKNSEKDKSAPLRKHDAVVS